MTGKRKKVAAMTLALDRAIGDVLKTLRTLDLERETLVVFTTTTAERPSPTPLPTASSAA